jgi:uncharacterized protein YaiE (UPF0345 family)
VWLLLSLQDAVVRADNKREFPFDTSGNTLDLLVNGYGSALKSAATITVTIPAKATFAPGDNESMNGFGANANFQLPAADAGKTGETGQATGMVSFKWAAASWGGSCCVSSCED